MRQFVSRLIAAVLIAGFVLMAGTDYAKADAASVPEILDYETDDAEPSMQQKPLSAGAKNQTKSIQPFGTKSRRADKVFAGAMANASVKLLQKTMKTDKTGGNILISPDSIFTALSIVENGASGKTRKEIRKAMGGISVQKYNQYLSTLHRKLEKARGITYTSANSLWYKEGTIRLKKSFLQKVVSYHQAEVYSAPFSSQTVNDINRWVSNHTNGKIPSIISRLEPSLRTAVINAVYFKAKWETPYLDTVRRTFHKADGGRQRAEMLEGCENTFVKVNGAKGFVKNYEGGKVAFLGLLPPKGTSVDAYVKNLTGTDLIKGYRNRKTRGIRVLTRMPEFKYEYEVSLNKPLKKMGIRRAFQNTADFSNMTDSKIEIDAVLHKTFIDLNKNGTEASAATAIMMKASAAPPEKTSVKKVYLNRPFVYVILDVKSGAPLFIGVVKEV
ncbi:MAG: serpin family protein [Eubacterium sp.]|nr:serpin family protein [Eubacterium sp.]